MSKKGREAVSLLSYCILGGVLTFREAGESAKNQRNLRLTSEGDEMDG